MLRQTKLWAWPSILTFHHWTHLLLYMSWLCSSLCSCDSTILRRNRADGTADSLFYNPYYRNTDTLHKYFQGCQLVKKHYNSNAEVPIKIFLKLQDIDMRKIICSTEMDDSRKKYRKKGNFGIRMETHTIAFKCHLWFHLSRVYTTVPYFLFLFFFSFTIFHLFPYVWELLTLHTSGLKGRLTSHLFSTSLIEKLGVQHMLHTLSSLAFNFWMHCWVTV